MTTVEAWVPDLLDRSRIEVGLPNVVFVGSLAEVTAAAEVVLVDLRRLQDLDELAAVDVPVLGFAPHVDGELLSAARAVGCAALPRSKFFRELADQVSLATNRCR